LDSDDEDDSIDDEVFHSALDVVEKRDRAELDKDDDVVEEQDRAELDEDDAYSSSNSELSVLASS
jgi:hypothetical protein